MRSRTLCFEQITDDRFYDDIYNLWLGDYNEIPKEVLKKFGI